MPSRLPEQSAGYRIGLISGLAALLGILAGFVAYALYDLMGLIFNTLSLRLFLTSLNDHERSPGRKRPPGLFISAKNLDLADASADAELDTGHIG